MYSIQYHLFSNTFVSLTGYLYTLQVICTVQVTCFYEPQLLAISMYISNTVSVLFSNTFVSLTGYFLQVICTVQITCLVHIYEPIRLFYTLQLFAIQVTCLVHICKPNRLFVHFTGYLYSTSNLFSTHL